MIQKKTEYFKGPWNLLDVARLFSTCAWIILLCFELKYEYLSWSVTLFNILRGVSGFRAFDATRYYITLIFNSLINIKSFLYIFFYSTLSFGLLKIAGTKDPEISFKSLWISSFNLAIGESGDMNSNFISIEYITFICAVLINIILMLNMVISLLGDSFEEFQLIAEVYNYK